MKKRSIGFVIGSFMAIAAAIFSLAFKNALVVEAKAVEPNSYYSGIYDGWNNTKFDANHNRVLITYTGTAHNHPSEITSAAELAQYDDYILVNGSPLSNSIDGVTKIAPWGGQLWFQIIYPSAGLAAGSTLVINKGCTIGDAIFDSVTLELNANLEWVTPKKSVTYSGIASGWNNSNNGHKDNYRELILKFGTHGVDYLADNHLANSTNRAKQNYDIGNKLTFNGIPIYKIREKYSETNVNYAHGNEFLYILYPTDVLLINKNNTIPTLHIESGAEFMDSALSEVTLKLVGGSWIQTEDNIFQIVDPYIYSTKLVVPFPHHISSSAHAVLGGLPAKGCNLAFNINTGNLDTSENTVLVFDGLYSCGLNFYFKSGAIQLFDKNNGNAVVQSFNGYMFAPNSDYSFELEIVCGAQTTFKLAINHYLIINYSFNNNRSGECAMWAVDTSNEITMDFYDETIGYKPTISYKGSDYYDFLEGDPIYNFVNVVDAFDLYNDSISAANLEYIYEEGAVTNNKYNAGTWTLTIKLALDGYKAVTKTVTINVHGKTSTASIQYDEREPIEVPVGTKLNPPVNPSSYQSGGFSYVFEGWYFEGAKWDFENDIVQGDMHLTSRFIATSLRYTVTVNFEGINRPSETYLISNGSALPFDELFDVEGATYEVFNGGIKINSLIVNSNVTLTVRYNVTYLYAEPVDPTYSAEGHIGYWYTPVYVGYYFVDPEGKEQYDEVRIPKLKRMINDDSLVQEGDYKLFTINDYPFSSNDSAGYIFFAASEMVDAMSDSFGFRFIVNIPNGQLTTAGAAILKFACTNIYGSSPVIQITLDYSKNVYLTFNNVIDWNTSINHSWSVDEDHLVEVYFVKTSDTSAHILLGIDGELIFKSGAKDISGLTFHNFFTASGPANTASYYSSATDTTDEALDRFSKRQLHSEDVAFDNFSNTGNCLGENGYYAKAKNYYNNYLTTNQKKAFASDNKYSQLRERMIAWGDANGETISFNNSTGELVYHSAVLSPINDYYKNTSIVVVLVITSGVSFSLLFLYLVKKKKKE